MSFLLVANLKSNKTLPEVESWLEAVAPVASTTKAKVVFAPSYVHLNPSHSLISNLESNICLASQDTSPFPSGSYTGEVNATQLKDLGVDYCLIGHSERRQHFHESHPNIAAKARELIATGITPIICLSKNDIQPTLASLDDSDIKESIFVYEPPADIGGTETAPLDDIKTTCDLISSLTSRPVMYGGSVNAGNLKKLLELDIAGVLVGSAALQPSTFIDLINRYNSLRE